MGRGIIQGLKEAVAFSRGEISLPVRIVYTPGPVDVRAIRSNSGLSQSEFAARYGFNVRTLQDWEQGRGQPEAPVRAYLTVIARNPDAVTRALRSSADVRLQAPEKAAHPVRRQVPDPTAQPLPPL